MARRKRCKFFPASALTKGARVEKREHGLSMKMARKIARDHLCENPRYYSRGGGFGAAWMNDPRLPDEDDSTRRVHGDLRPKVKPPFRVTILAKKLLRRPGKAPVLLKVESDRAGRRFWFTALLAEKPVPASNPMSIFPSNRPDEHGFVYHMMFDYDSTTSAKKAQGWIDALNKR